MNKLAQKTASAEASPPVGDAGAATPPLPPMPMLPVPQRPVRTVAAAPQKAPLIPGLAGPSASAAQARRNATGVRSGIERFITGALALRTQLTSALTHVDQDAAHAGEWEREGLNLNLVKNFAEDLDRFLTQYTQR